MTLALSPGLVWATRFPLGLTLQGKTLLEARRVGEAHRYSFWSRSAHDRFDPVRPSMQIPVMVMSS